MRVLNVPWGASDPNDQCELCGGSRIQWFTPALWKHGHGIFLCLACAKINVRFRLSRARAKKSS